MSYGETLRLTKTAKASPKRKALPGRISRQTSPSVGWARQLKVYMTLEATEIIEAVRVGVPAVVIDDLGHAMAVPRTQLLDWMGLPETTVKRKIRGSQALSRSVGEQAVAMARLIGQVQKMVNESGDPEGFNAAQWLAKWLSEPNPALGGVPPGEYMDTSEGFNLVSDTLARMQSGAYA